MKILSTILLLIVPFLAKGQAPITFTTDANTWDWGEFPVRVDAFQATITHPSLSELFLTYEGFVVNLTFRQNEQGTPFSTLMYVQIIDDTTTLAFGDFYPFDILTISDWSSFQISMNMVFFEMSSDSGAYTGLVSDFITIDNPLMVTNITDHRENEQLVIYPNPATDYVTIPSDESLAVIFDSIGQQVREVPTNEKIYIGNLASGVYYIDRRQKLLIE